MKIREAYHKTKNVISKSLREEVEEFLKQFDKVDFSKLPTCFIQGDLTASNIIKDKSADLWLIDFNENGIGVRILDVVKILNGVIFFLDLENSRWIEEYFLSTYQKYLKLTDYELKVLELLRIVDSYIGVMLGECDLKKEETRFWL